MVSTKTLDFISRNWKINYPLVVARHPNVSSETLEYIFNNAKPLGHFNQPIAANPNTPPSVLRKIFNGPKPWVPMDHWLAANPATPKEVLEKLSVSKEAWVLYTMTTKNPNLDCGMIKNIETAQKSPELDDTYKILNELKLAVEKKGKEICSPSRVKY